MQTWPEKESRIALSLIAGVGPATFIKALDFWGSAAAALADTGAARKAAGIFSAKSLAAFQQDDLETLVEQQLQWAAQPQQHLLVWGEADYPPLLRNIEDAPPLLWVRGRAEALLDPQVAMVGARHATVDGSKMARDFAHRLTEAGLTVTSGLAQGIDAAAHEGALRTGETLAVLGTGVDRIYPTSHAALAEKILQQGALISEFPLGTAPLAGHFPRRNRIISGLSLGTLVVEAKVESGSLVTARLAEAQGRSVFAIPGSIHNPMAKGCHQLIRQGAYLVETAQEIVYLLSGVLQEYVQNHPQPTRPGDILTPFTGQIDQSTSHEMPRTQDHPLLAFIGYGPTTLDELVEKTGWDFARVQLSVMELSLAGQIAQGPGCVWRQ